MDVGQPPDYLKGQVLYLNALNKAKSSLLADPAAYSEAEIVMPVMIVSNIRSLFLLQLSPMLGCV